MSESCYWELSFQTNTFMMSSWCSLTLELARIRFSLLQAAEYMEKIWNTLPFSSQSTQDSGWKSPFCIFNSREWCYKKNKSWSRGVLFYAEVVWFWMFVSLTAFLKNWGFDDPPKTIRWSNYKNSMSSVCIGKCMLSSWTQKVWQTLMTSLIWLRTCQPVLRVGKAGRARWLKL